MAFTFLQSATGTDSVTFATSPSAGEFLSLAIHLESDSDLTAVTPPSGFSLSGSYQASQRTIGVYTKTADGSEGTLTFTHSTSSPMAVVGRRFSLSGSPNVVNSINSDATNTTSITVGPLTASADDLLLAFAAQDGAASTASWSDSFIGEISQAVGAHSIYNTYKTSAGANESTTRTLSGQVTRQSAVMILVEDSAPSGPSLTAPASISPGASGQFTVTGLAGAPTSATVSDGTSTLTLTNIALVSGDTYSFDTPALPAVGASLQYTTFGAVTMSATDGTDTAEDTTTLAAADGQTVTILAETFDTSELSYLYNFEGTPATGDQFIEGSADLALDANGGYVADTDGTYIITGIDATDGVAQSYNLILGDSPADAVGSIRFRARRLKARATTAKPLRAR